jgi:hypothetical protein
LNFGTSSLKSAAISLSISLLRCARLSQSIPDPLELLLEPSDDPMFTLAGVSGLFALLVSLSPLCTLRYSGFFFSADIPVCLDPGLQMNFQAGVSRHLVPLAAFFVQPQPPALAVTLH